MKTKLQTIIQFDKQYAMLSFFVRRKDFAHLHSLIIIWKCVVNCGVSSWEFYVAVFSEYQAPITF